MKRSEFDKMFLEEKAKAFGIDENTSSEAALTEKIKSYSNENGKMDLYDATSFLLTESMAYSNNLIYGMLNRVLEIEDDK